MKNTITTLILCLSPIVQCQSTANEDGHFLKRIENNYANRVIVELPNGKTDGIYNLDSKSAMEKRFFGDFNAPVEYFVDPSFRPVTGFRIYPDSSGTSYLLETKTKDRTKDTIVSHQISISDQMANTIYAKTMHLIDTFTAKGKPDMIFDGDLVTFRCVVQNELWTFTIHEPYGNVQKTSDLFRAMIADVEAGRFDEAKYREALN